jgi:hypothetical protein
MLRSLIYQLLETTFDFSPALQQLLTSGQLSSYENLTDLLHELVLSFPKTYIVLDALDECADRTHLMSTLEIIAGWRIEQLHLLVTSRREKDVEYHLSPIVDPSCQICLESASVDPDIQRYVRTRLLERSLQKWGRDSSLRQEIEDKISQGAHGMYVEPQSKRFRLTILQVPLGGMPA